MGREEERKQKFDSFVQQRAKLLLLLPLPPRSPIDMYSYAGRERNSFIHPIPFRASAAQPATHFDPIPCIPSSFSRGSR